MNICYNLDNSLIEKIEVLANELSDWNSDERPQYEIYLKIYRNTKNTVFHDEDIIIPWYYCKNLDWDLFVKEKKVDLSNIYEDIETNCFFEVRKALETFINNTRGSARKYFKEYFKDVLELYKLFDKGILNKAKWDILSQNDIDSFMPDD